MGGWPALGECAAPASWCEESWHGAHPGPSPLLAQTQDVAKKEKKKILVGNLCSLGGGYRVTSGACAR